jgi:hypothetical protein
MNFGSKALMDILLVSSEHVPYRRPSKMSEGLRMAWLMNHSMTTTRLDYQAIRRPSDILDGLRYGLRRVLV